MGLIIKNGVQYIGGVESADGISFDNIKSKLNASNVQDAIDEIVSGGIGGNASEQILTQAEYDALGDEKYTDDITYYITDSEELSAHNIEFDGSKINMKVTSVQEAIEQIYNLNSDIVITLDKDEWVLDEETGLYRQDIEMDGLTGKEVPIMILTSNSDEAKAAWAKANNPEIKEGLISFYADEDINVELTVVAKGMVTKPTNITADVTDIRNDIETIETTLDDVVTRTEAVEILAAAADSRAKANESTINVLEDRIDNNANAISALDDKYYTETEIDSKVDAINQTVNGNTEAISKLNSDLFKFQTNVTDANLFYNGLAFCSANGIANCPSANGLLIAYRSSNGFIGSQFFIGYQNSGFWYRDVTNNSSNAWVMISTNRGEFIATSTFDKNGWVAFTIPKGNEYNITSFDITGTGAISDYEIVVKQPNRGIMVMRTENLNWFNCSCAITVNIT